MDLGLLQYGDLSPLRGPHISVAHPLHPVSVSSPGPRTTQCPSTSPLPSLNPLLLLPLLPVLLLLPFLLLFLLNLFLPPFLPLSTLFFLLLSRPLFTLPLLSCPPLSPTFPRFCRDGKTTVPHTPWDSCSHVDTPFRELGRDGTPPSPYPRIAGPPHPRPLPHSLYPFSCAGPRFLCGSAGPPFFCAGSLEFRRT